MYWIGKRAERAIYRVAKDATRTRGSPGSFAAESSRAQDDKGVVESHPLRRERARSGAPVGG
jgi:hypothetical protein